MSEQEHSEDLADLTAELKRRETAFKLMAQQCAQLAEERSKLVAALNTALLLIEQCLADMRYADVMPTATLMIAKGNFDATMKKLLGDERIEIKTIVQSGDES